MYLPSSHTWEDAEKQIDDIVKSICSGRWNEISYERLYSQLYHITLRWKGDRVYDALESSIAKHQPTPKGLKVINDVALYVIKHSGRPKFMGIYGDL